ncbi:hypothetical protein OUY22_28775 [Nonomuraea sp. MCN248]|uniref:Uncharacterized protein n=1 Tax=Nonomuraea corallina TaxID=2989783 RepID=A0ABT4SJL4_9ACTN|nr:hypothetical protein [Nonomuraea corallina]MDA0637418.1 hypothetical protein [Nonomuraea corallina]
MPTSWPEAPKPPWQEPPRDGTAWPEQPPAVPTAWPEAPRPAPSWPDAQPASGPDARQGQAPSWPEPSPAAWPEAPRQGGDTGSRHRDAQPSWPEPPVKDPLPAWSEPPVKAPVPAWSEPPASSSGAWSNLNSPAPWPLPADPSRSGDPLEGTMTMNRVPDLQPAPVAADADAAVLGTYGPGGLDDQTGRARSSSAAADEHTMMYGRANLTGAAGQTALDGPGGRGGSDGRGDGHGYGGADGYSGLSGYGGSSETGGYGQTGRYGGSGETGGYGGQDGYGGSGGYSGQDGYGGSGGSGGYGDPGLGAQAAHTGPGVNAPVNPGGPGAGGPYGSGGPGGPGGPGGYGGPGGPGGAGGPGAGGHGAGGPGAGGPGAGGPGAGGPGAGGPGAGGPGGQGPGGPGGYGAGGPGGHGGHGGHGGPGGEQGRPGSNLSRDPSDPDRPFVTAGQISGSRTPPPERQQELWNTVFGDNYQSMGEPESLDEPGKPLWIYALASSAAVALVIALLWAFIAGPLAGAKDSGAEAQAVPSQSAPATPRKSSNAIGRLPAYKGDASPVVGTLQDARAGISVPRLGGTWRLDERPTVKGTYGYETRQYAMVGDDVAAQVLTGPLPAKLAGRYSSPDDLEPVIKAVVVDARKRFYQDGNKVRKIAQQPLKVGGSTGSLIAYQLTSPTEKVTIVAAALNTGGEVPAIVFVSVPAEGKALLPDVNTVVKRLRPITQG